MTLYLDDGDVRLYHGDALEQLALMPAESVQCIVTSPPFWALRDYGVDDQIGLEATPDEWCARLVAVFRECRRVLRNDGVMWLEVGDTYCSTAPGSVVNPEAMTGKHVHTGAYRRNDTPNGMKPKDLVGAPWLLAFALRADGWYLRSDTIWARPNPMPESVTDRPTKAHSYVFLLTRSARYFYDANAIREPNQPAPENAWRYKYGGYDAGDSTRTDAIQGVKPNGHMRSPLAAGRNARSVWSIATEPTPFAHFATFPQALVERCIKAGTSEHGACTACGSPWTRETTRTLENPGNRSNNGRYDGSEKLRRGFEQRREVSVETTGWEPSCDCRTERPPWDQMHFPSDIENTRPPVRPCVVLDPFMGSGTVGLVARRLGRHAIGVELNAEYLAIAAKRLQQLSLLGDAL